MKAVFANLMAAALLNSDGESAGVDIGAFDGWGRIILNSGATAAADNTADFSIEHSDDDVTYEPFTKVSFDQVTNAGPSFQVASVNLSEMKRYARVKRVLGGTSPEVIASALVCGGQQYLG